MTKNKLVLYDIPLSFLDSYDTSALKVENLMKQIKLYFDNEGFITSEIESDNTSYCQLDIGIPNFITKISFKINYTTSSIYEYYGICRIGGEHVYGNSNSINLTNKNTMCINYFVNDYFLGVLLKCYNDTSYVGFGTDASYICKSETNREYYRCGDSIKYELHDSDTNAIYSFTTSKKNGLEINKAILNKISLSHGYLNKVFTLSVPSRSQPFNFGDVQGGIIIKLKGYGYFFCFFVNASLLLAIQIDDEETTETVTTTPTNESQTT